MYASTENSQIETNVSENETEKTESGYDFTIPPELRKLRPTRWIRDFLFDWAIIVATFAIVAVIDSIWIFPLAAIIIGSRIHALALLAHDASHRLAFRNRMVNDLVAELFITWPLFYYLDHGYRPWHFQHHRALGTDADSELPHLALKVYSGTVTWRKVVRQFVMDSLGLGVLDFFHYSGFIIPKIRLHLIIGPIIVWIAFITLCAMFNAWWILGLWIWSFVVSFWAAYRVLVWAEHVNVPLNGKESSHRFSAGWLSRFLFFPHNAHYHYEHHLSPQVPYYNLPAVRKLIVGKPIVPLRELFPV